ncbi:hypothetical protein CHUAL_000381 [Chamberlinius hualienensis]
MKVAIWAEMCLVIAWSLVAAASVTGKFPRRHDKRQTQYDEPEIVKTRTTRKRSNDPEWRRETLNAILATSDGDPECNKVSRRPSIPPERLETAFQRHFVPQIKTATKFARLLVNYLISDSTARYLTPEGEASDSISGPNRLFSTLVLSIVQSDRSIASCALGLMSNRRWTSDRKSFSNSYLTNVPLAYRALPKSSPTASSHDDVICLSYIHDNNSLNKSNNNNHHYNNSYAPPPSATDCAYQVTNQAETEATIEAMNNFRSHYINTTMGNTTKTMTSLWSSIYFDCRRNAWMATYSLGLTVNIEDKSNFTNNNNHNNSTSKWHGILTMSLDLSGVDINQCGSTDDDQHLFGGTSLCDSETMECVHKVGLGFRVGSYSCACRTGFYFHVNNSENLTVGRLEGSWLEQRESAFITSLDDAQSILCSACHSGCYHCNDNTPCWVEYDLLFRGLPLGLQSFCMTITVVLGITVFQLRKCKVIATGMWTVLEMILVGALLLYSTVIIRYFEPDTSTCLMEPWFREMGFAIFYGTITLKMYRILVDFRTRKAHRWVVRDKDLLKYLAGIIITVTGYMSAWTAITADQIVRENQGMIVLGQTDDGYNYHTCKSTWWNYVTETGELAFLMFGIYISYHTHHATSPFNENRYLCLAIYIEASSSLALYALRHYWWMSLHPDYIFLMYFIRCQLTVTINLLLIFGPKLWYNYRPPCEVEHKIGTGSAVGGGGGGGNEGAQGERMSRPELVKLQDGITSNGEVDIGDINLADMDPEDIRAELRRVYTQLEVMRNKTMRKDNPHISKRRGGRKATHRRFSLQDSHMTPSIKYSHKKGWERKEWF